MKKILHEAAAVGDATARTMTYQSRIPEAFYYPHSTWRQWLGGYKFESQPGVSYLDAAAFFYFYATGVTPAMEAKMVGKARSMPWESWTRKASPLDGGKSYRLHLLPNIPVKDFWSAIVYDNQTRSMLQTDQPFPQVSSQDKGLVVNADGSVDVYFGPKAPAGKENNWIQTIPAKAGTCSSGSTARSSRGSTRPGDWERSKPNGDNGDERSFSVSSVASC
jgi:hypothetical protein